MSAGNFIGDGAKASMCFGELKVDNIRVDTSLVGDLTITGEANVLGKISGDSLEVVNSVVCDGVDIGTTKLREGTYSYNSVSYTAPRQNVGADNYRIATLEQFNPNVVGNNEVLRVIPQASKVKYLVENPSNFTGTEIGIPYEGISNIGVEEVWVCNFSGTANMDVKPYNSAGAISTDNVFRLLSSPYTIGNSLTLAPGETACLRAFEDPANAGDVIWLHIEY